MKKQPKDNIEAIMDKLEPIAIEGLQSVLMLVVKEFSLNNLPEPEAQEIFYFNCLFLGCLLLRFPIEERRRCYYILCSLLNEQAEDGVKFFDELMKTQATLSSSSQVEKDQVMKEFGVKGKKNQKLMLDVINGFKSNIQESVIFDSASRLNDALLTKLEESILIKFNQLIDEVLAALSSDSEEYNDLLFYFLVVVGSNTGLLAGCTTKATHQPLEEYMKKGLAKINGLVENELALLH